MLGTDEEVRTHELMVHRYGGTGAIPVAPLILMAEQVELMDEPVRYHRRVHLWFFGYVVNLPYRREISQEEYYQPRE